MPQQMRGLESGHTESEEMFNNMFIKLTNSDIMANNEHIRQRFRLDEINSEEDLHNYKTLLNAMGAIFYTDHGMKAT